jgi:hypothetical protein
MQGGQLTFGGRGGALRIGARPDQAFDLVGLASWHRGQKRRDRASGSYVVPLRFTTEGEPHPFFAAQGQPTFVALQMNRRGDRRVYQLLQVDLSAGVGLFMLPHVAQEMDPS